MMPLELSESDVTIWSVTYRQLASLTDNSIVIIYDCNMFKIQVTGTDPREDVGFNLVACNVF
jgi:hypothetical protein